MPKYLDQTGLAHFWDTIDGRFDTIENSVLVVLGDSWSDGNNDPDTPWYVRVANRMNLTAYVTAAVAGTGFSYGGSSSIPNQVSAAVTSVQSAGYTANDVKYVIAFGGVNDFRHSVGYADVATGMKTTYDNARTAFPNAKVFIVGPNAGKWNTMDSLDSDSGDKATSYLSLPLYMRDIKANLHNNGYPIVWDAAAWLNFYGKDANNVYNSDLLHPNQTGHNIIAGHMLEIIQGEYIGAHYYTHASNQNADSTDKTHINYRVSVDNGLATVTFECLDNTALVTTSSVYWILNNFPLFPGGSVSPAHTFRPGFVCSNFSGSGLTDGYAPIRGFFNPNNRRLTLYPSKTGGLNQVFGSFSVAIY